MKQPHTQPNPNELLSITREELERCCSQMSAAGYKVSANYVEAMVLSRSRPHTPAAPAAPEPDLRTAFVEEDNAFKDSIIEQQKIHIETLNAKMGEMMQGAASKARKDEREQVLDAFAKIIQQRYVGKYYNEAGDIPDVPVDELADIIQSLRGGAP